MLGADRHAARSGRPTHPRIHSICTVSGLSKGWYFRVSDHADPRTQHASRPFSTCWRGGWPDSHLAGARRRAITLRRPCRSCQHHALYLPPYSPELNPKENLWDELREKSSRTMPLKLWTQRAKLRQANLYIERNPASVRSITSFPISSTHLARCRSGIRTPQHCAQHPLRRDRVHAERCLAQPHRSSRS